MYFFLNFNLNNLIINKNNTKKKMNKDNNEYKIYFKRWIILIIFMLVSSLNAVIYVTTAPINSLTQQYYNITAEQVNMLAIIFLIMYIPGSIISTIINYKFGLYGNLSIGSILNIISTILRLISVYIKSYELLFIGSFIAAIAQPFFTNIPAQVAGKKYNFFYFYFNYLIILY